MEEKGRTTGHTAEGSTGAYQAGGHINPQEGSGHNNNSRQHHQETHIYTGPERRQHQTPQCGADLTLLNNGCKAAISHHTRMTTMTAILLGSQLLLFALILFTLAKIYEGRSLIKTEVAHLVEKNNTQRQLHGNQRLTSMKQTQKKDLLDMELRLKNHVEAQIRDAAHIRNNMHMNTIKEITARIDRLEKDLATAHEKRFTELWPQIDHAYHEKNKDLRAAKIN